MRLATLAAFSCALLFASSALPQTSEADKAAARDLYHQAATALEGRNYALAVDKAKKADELFHAPTTLVLLARAYVGLGKYVEARETYKSVMLETLPADASEAFVRAQQDAKREIAPLDDKIGYGIINVTAPGAAAAGGVQAMLDGAELKQAAFGARRPLNPGTHELIVAASGFSTATRHFEVKPKGEVTVDVQLHPAAPGETTAPPKPPIASHPAEQLRPASGAPARGGAQRIAGISLLGLGGAGLIVGGVFGGLAVGKHSALKNACAPDGTCGADQQDAINSYNAVGLGSTVGFIAGGVLAAAGLTVWLTAPKGTATQSARLVVGPAGARARIDF